MTETWRHPLSFLAVGIFLIVALTVLFSVLSMASGSENVARHYVNAFGFFVGMLSVILSFYLQFGPRLSLPLMPKAPVPARGPITLFTMGIGISLTGMRWLTRTDYLTLFARIVGYSIIFATATGLTVSYIVRYSPGSEYLKSTEGLAEEDDE